MPNSFSSLNLKLTSHWHVAYLTAVGSLWESWAAIYMLIVYNIIME